MDRRATDGSLASRLGRGAALNLVGAVFNQGSTFALNIAVANIVGREQFGRYTIAQATLLMLASVAQLAMGYTATKYVAEYRDQDPGRTGRILALCSAVSWGAAAAAAVLLWLAAPWLATSVLRAGELSTGLRVLTGAVLFTVLNGFLAGALAGLEGYRALAWSGVASGCAYFTAGISGAWLHGLTGAFWGLSASAFIQWTILMTWFVRERRRCGVVLRHSPRTWWDERAVLTGFALPATLSGLISLPALWIATVLLARQPNGYLQVALFGAANNCRTAALFVPQAVNAVGVSLLNNQRRRSWQGYRDVFRLNVRVNALAAGVGVLGVSAAGPWILRLFGPDFAPAYTCLLVLMGATLLEATAAAMYQALQSHGKMWLSLFTIVLPRDSIIVAGAAMMVGLAGATGLAAAYLLGWTVAIGIIWYLIKRLRLVRESTTLTNVGT